MYKRFTLGKRMIITLVTICLILMQAVPTFAASKITLMSGDEAPSIIYAGHSYNLTVKGVKVKFYSSNKAVATIGIITGELKAVAPGSVKITAKNTKTGKEVASKTFKVLQRATSVTADVSELYLNVTDTATINATKTPETSTDVVRFYSTDKTIATVGETSGKVTAKAEGKCTINVISKATKVTSNSQKANKIATVEVYVGPCIDQVVQKSVTELDVIFKTSADVRSADLTITNDTTKAVSPVKSVSIDKENNKIIHVETYAELKDGKTYTVQYGKTSAKFTATDGRVASLQVVPTEIICGKEEPIYAQLLDTNGVIIGSYTRSNAPSNISFDKFETNNGGYIAGDKIYFAQKGDTGVVKVVYHTYRYENNEEVGKLECEQTITAIEAPSTLNVDYTLSRGERPDFQSQSYKQNTQICLKDKEVAAYFYFTDYTGKEIQDYSKYQVVAHRPDKLIIKGKLDNVDKKVLLDFSDTCTVGTTYIKLLDNKGNLIQALPITISEARELSTISLSTYQSVLYKGQFGEVIDVTGKDQYGEDFPLYEAEYFDQLKIKMKSAPTNTEVTPKVEIIKTADGRVQIKTDVPSDKMAEGTYVYELERASDRRILTLVIKDSSKQETGFKLKHNAIEIDLARDYEEVNEPINLLGELCTNKTLKFTTKEMNGHRTPPISKVIQDEQGNYLLNLDLRGEMVTAGNYAYQVECSYESKGESKVIRQYISVKAKGEKPLIEWDIEQSEQPGVSLMAEGHGEVKAEFLEVPEGTKVTLKAFPESGYEFKEWKIVEGSAEIVDNSFVIKSGSVTIKGIFELKTARRNKFDFSLPLNSLNRLFEFFRNYPLFL